MRKMQSPRSMQVSRTLGFSYRPQVFYGFYRGEGMSDGTLTEWERDVNVLVAISFPPILVEKSVVKL